MIKGIGKAIETGIILLIVDIEKLQIVVQICGKV
jgi:hypothetical protein